MTVPRQAESEADCFIGSTAKVRLAYAQRCVCTTARTVVNLERDKHKQYVFGLKRPKPIFLDEYVHPAAYFYG